jgi:acetolactate synthase-1/2/3 large subunit
MNPSQALVKTLANEGVDVVFGLPGIQIMSIFDALYDYPSIRLVTVRHEQATTYMADGYARSTGKVAVALVVPGPGVLNALSGLGTAFAASSPVVLISGQIPSADVGKGRGALHEVDDQLEILRQLTKWCKRVMKPEDVPRAVHEAFLNLRAGRPRPVALEVPIDVLRSPTKATALRPAHVPRANPEKSAVRKAAKLLLNARRPLIWAGGGAINANSADLLQELAEMINAPVTTTPEGKGCIPEDHRLALGGNFYGPHGAGSFVIPLADVILAVGTRLFAAPWGISFRPDQKIIKVDIDPEEIVRNLRPTVGICCDATDALKSLISELRKMKTKSEWTEEDLGRLRGQSRRDLEEHAPTQLRIIETLRDCLDRDAIVVSGINNIAYWAHVAFQALEPRTYLTPSYFGTLGFAFPTAIGVKVGNPGKQVVALCGDGGFLFAIEELATAVKEKANVVTIVFNDQAYGASLFEQQRVFGGKIIGTKLENPDFVRLAEAFGAVGMKLRNPGELGKALQKALELKIPSVIDVPVPTLLPAFMKPD